MSAPWAVDYFREKHTTTMITMLSTRRLTLDGDGFIQEQILTDTWNPGRKWDVELECYNARLKHSEESYKRLKRLRWACALLCPAKFAVYPDDYTLLLADPWSGGNRPAMLQDWFGSKPDRHAPEDLQPLALLEAWQRLVAPPVL